MSRIERRTISLPPESAAYIDELIAAGRYASVSEVVRAGLAALREREAAVGRWLAAEAAAGRLTADPE